MRILVCGDRKYNDFDKMLEVLSEHFNGPGDCLIHGCAKGADQLAEYVLTFYMFREGNVPSIEKYPADWGKYGKAAGPIRNKQMLDEGKPNLVIAFLTPHSKGTRNMVDQAKKAGVRVKEIEI